MKKILLITAIFAVALIGNAFAGTSHIANDNPVGGDILASDTCNFTLPDDVLFEQLPMDCDGSWALVTSDTDLGYMVYDDYQAFGTEITDIHFWGGDLQCCWSECDEDPMTFNIVFTPDDGSGMPDLVNPACTYNVTVAHDPTAVCVLSGVYNVWEWFVTLDPPCALTTGWVGIEGVGNGDTCVFMWFNSDSAAGYGSLSYQTGIGFTT
jgi:hypothetical protein